MQRKGNPIRMLSKSDVLSWLNETMATNSSNRFTKIECLGNGVAYCDLINHFHPHTIQDGSILRYPKNDYERLANLRLVQTALMKLRANKDVDVNFSKTMYISRLAHCRYQDNWELISWLHSYLTGPKETAYTPSPSKFKLHGKRDFVTFQQQQKENMLFNRSHSLTPMPTLPVGKSSVSSYMFQNNSNYVVIIDRAKEILSRQLDDGERVKQLKLLLGVGLKTDSQKDEVIGVGDLYDEEEILPGTD